MKTLTSKIAQKEQLWQKTHAELMGRGRRHRGSPNGAAHQSTPTSVNEDQMTPVHEQKSNIKISPTEQNTLEFQHSDAPTKGNGVEVQNATKLENRVMTQLFQNVKQEIRTPESKQQDLVFGDNVQNSTSVISDVQEKSNLIEQMMHEGLKAIKTAMSDELSQLTAKMNRNSVFVNGVFNSQNDIMSNIAKLRDELSQLGGEMNRKFNQHDDSEQQSFISSSGSDQIGTSDQKCIFHLDQKSKSSREASSPSQDANFGDQKVASTREVTQNQKSKWAQGLSPLQKIHARQHDNEKRRTSILKEPEHQPMESENDYGRKSWNDASVVVVERNPKDFGLKLTSLRPEEIMKFMEEFEAIRRRHPREDFQLVEFMDAHIKERLHSTARKMDFIEFGSLSSGFNNLKNDQILEVIYKEIAAKSRIAFTKELEKLRFPKLKWDGSITHMAFEELYDAGYRFSHTFINVVYAIGKGAEADCILEIMGSYSKEWGLAEHFFSMWPQGSGRNLYDHVMEKYKPVFKECNTLTEFLNLFFEVTRPSTELRARAEELDAILQKKRKGSEDVESRSEESPARSKGFKPYRDRVKSYDDRKRSLGLTLLSEEQEVDEDNSGTEANEENTPVATEGTPSRVNRVRFEEVQDEEEDHSSDEWIDEQLRVLASGEDTLAAVNDKKPCFYQFLKGSCSKGSKCEYDHSTIAMERLTKTKMRELVNAPCNANKGDDLKRYLVECLAARGQAKAKQT